MLALDLAEDKAPPELQQFDFVFLIDLKDINGSMTLVEIIQNSHSRFNKDEIPQHHVKLILKGATKSRVLLMLDGYELYEKGTNFDIDNAVSKTLGYCLLLITSRPGKHMDKSDLDQMDEEIEITGLNADNIRDCARKYLDNNSRMVDSLFEKSAETNIYELLSIPVILLMVCTLLQEGKLTQSKTDVISHLLRMSIDRTTLKTIHKKSTEIEDLQEMLNLLGEMSWTSKNVKKEFLIRKVLNFINIDCQLFLPGKFVRK